VSDLFSSELFWFCVAGGFWGFLWGGIGALFGEPRGRAGGGFFWGFVLGPIGLIIVLGLPNEKRLQEEAENLTKQELAARRIAKAKAQQDGSFIPDNMR